MANVPFVSAWKLALNALEIKVAVKFPKGWSTIKETIDELNQHRIVQCRELPINKSPDSLIIPLGKFFMSLDCIGVIGRQLDSGAYILLRFVGEEDIIDDLSDFQDLQPYRAIHANLEISPPKPSLNDSDGQDLVIKRVSIDANGLFSTPLPELMKELTAKLLCHFDLLVGKLAAQEIIVSPRNKDQHLLEDHGNTQRQARLRARTPGRLATLMGQFYLLSGAYNEAVMILGTAVEDAKTNGDLLWYAAAQEALQVALVLHGEANLFPPSSINVISSSPPPSSAIIKPEIANNGAMAGRDSALTLLGLSLPDKLREVAPLYVKADAAVLAFEVHRQMATVLDALGGPSEAAMALGHGWSFNRHLSFGDKLYALSVVIGKFEEMKMPRKRAFFLQILSNLLARQQELGMAAAVLQQTFPIYNVSLKEVVQRGWSNCSLVMLRRAAALAEAQKLNHSLIIQLYCTLLAYLRVSMDVSSGAYLEEEKAIFKTLVNRSNHLSAPIWHGDSTPCLLPLLSNAVIDVDGTELWKRKLATEGSRSPIRGMIEDELFIYNPMINRQNQSSISSLNTGIKEDAWEGMAVGLHEQFCVKLVFANPFKQKLALQECFLVANITTDDERQPPHEIMGESVQIILLPNSENTVILSIKTLYTGILQVTRIKFLLYGAPFHMDIGLLKIRVLGEQAHLRVDDSKIQQFPFIYEGEDKIFEWTIFNDHGAKAMGIVNELTCRWTETPPSLEEVILEESTISLINPLPKVIEVKGICIVRASVRGCRRLCGINLKISYSTTDEDYWRTIKVLLDFSVHPSISLTTITGLLSRLPIEGCSVIGESIKEETMDARCLAVLDFTNHLSQMVKVNLPDNTTLAIPGLSETRKIFAMKRVNLLSDEAPEITVSMMMRLRRECHYKDADLDRIDHQVLQLQRHLSHTWSFEYVIKDGAKGSVDLLQTRLVNPNALILPQLRLCFEYEQRDRYLIEQPISLKVWVVGRLPPGVRQYMLLLTPTINHRPNNNDDDDSQFFTYDGALVGWDSRVPWHLNVNLWGLSPHQLCLHATLQYDNAQGRTIIYQHPFPIYLDFYYDAPIDFSALPMELLTSSIRSCVEDPVQSDEKT